MRSHLNTYLFGLLLTACLLGCDAESNEAPQAHAPEPAVEQSDTLPAAIPDSIQPDRTRNAGPSAAAASSRHRVSQQTLYVPAYSHIYFRDHERTINLTTTLSIHNTDPDHALVLTSIEYYNSDGKLVRRPLEQPKQLGPFGSTWYVIEQSDLTGGVGANFIVRWESGIPVHPPIIETVMITTQQSQGISFTSRGRVLEER